MTVFCLTGCQTSPSSYNLEVDISDTRFSASDAEPIAASSEPPEKYWVALRIREIAPDGWERMLSAPRVAVRPDEPLNLIFGADDRNVDGHVEIHEHPDTLQAHVAVTVTRYGASPWSAEKTISITR